MDKGGQEAHLQVRQPDLVLVLFCARRFHLHRPLQFPPMIGNYATLVMRGRDCHFHAVVDLSDR